MTLVLMTPLFSGDLKQDYELHTVSPLTFWYPMIYSFTLLIVTLSTPLLPEEPPVQPSEDNSFKTHLGALCVPCKDNGRPCKRPTPVLLYVTFF